MTIDELRSRIANCPRNKAGKRVFTSSLRNEIVRCAIESSEPLAVFCESIDINMGTVSTWLKNHRKKMQTSGGFTKIDVVNHVSPAGGEETLTLKSPSGFSLSGAVEVILSAWRAVDASASK